MGSGLSILNDTDQTWQVKIGPDKKAIEIATLTTGAVAAVLSTVATLGAAAPVSAALTANGIVSVLGVSTEVMAATCAAAAAVGGPAAGVSAAGWATSMACLLTKQKEDSGLVTLRPGETMLETLSSSHCQ